MSLEKCTSCRRKKPKNAMLLIWSGGTKTKRQHIYMCIPCFLKDLETILSERIEKMQKDLKEIFEDLK